MVWTKDNKSYTLEIYQPIKQALFQDCLHCSLLPMFCSRKNTIDHVIWIIRFAWILFPSLLIFVVKTSNNSLPLHTICKILLSCCIIFEFLDTSEKLFGLTWINSLQVEIIPLVSTNLCYHNHLFPYTYINICTFRGHRFEYGQPWAAIIQGWMSICKTSQTIKNHNIDLWGRCSSTCWFLWAYPNFYQILNSIKSIDIFIVFINVLTWMNI